MPEYLWIFHSLRFPHDVGNRYQCRICLKTPKYELCCQGAWESHKGRLQFHLRLMKVKNYGSHGPGVGLWESYSWKMNPFEDCGIVGLEDLNKKRISSMNSKKKVQKLQLTLRITFSLLVTCAVAAVSSNNTSVPLNLSTSASRKKRGFIPVPRFKNNQTWNLNVRDFCYFFLYSCIVSHFAMCLSRTLRLWGLGSQLLVPKLLGGRWKKPSWNGPVANKKELLPVQLLI